ncbi:acyl-CoA dehydrogenase family protein [Alloalcanivorax mobilis]|uniref:acyl-CoA dehydrogenase family protein n=1 Tax=Alloalcanivorax mobilis TaxID=2019569 RepID=UPI000B5B4283|nr:acyl-CoA dehydrogenase family protein [Alloalcanivorax mobilis]ASK34900.1 acyl-CoA dehydrogenase [Alcanivorax sp. N3-2A]|tara:strand:- start:8055 stop:9197 length:1143 start_codon:yes stop_codon:yes gene_type:complete
MIPRTLFNSDHETFRDTVRKFLENEAVPHHEEWEQTGQVPKELWRKAGEQGFLCPMVSEAYGGIDADFLYSVVISEEVSRAGLTGIGWGLHTEIVAPYIEHYGSEEMKQRLLPKMVTGELIGAIAMSEPGAGSDLQGVKTTAVKDGDHYILNGSKTFITNGQNADIVIVVAKTDPSKGAKGTSLIIVEAGMEGFEKGKNLKKVGMKAQDTSELFFQDVKVPAGNLIGEEGMGFVYLMQELPQERLGIAINGLAMAESAFQHTLDYVKERKAFGQRVADFQNTQFKMAEMSTKLDVARAYVDRCLEMHLKKELDIPTAAGAKYWVTDLQCEIIDECVQLHGGYGYMWEYPIARMYADARVQRIYGGTNEIMKTIISRALLA